MLDVWTADERQPQGLQFTPQVAPTFDGRTPWSAYEEAIDDWLDITTFTPDKWAPSLKARLVGEASTYTPLFEREGLRDPNEGVDYFKHELRPLFVKGVDTVLIVICYQFQKVLQRFAGPPEMDWKIASPSQAFH